jgi:carboxypeptidase C (cathepsin A)
MKKYSILFLITFLFVQLISAQKSRMIPADTAIISNHEVTIKGKKVPYSATIGTQPVWNAEGNPIATLHYTYYQRTDVTNNSVRPLVISFNGGPGSASVWMHIAYPGPKILNINDEGYPIQPYGIKDNPYSILDVADIVYVNPVNTGYSRILDKETDKKLFFGVSADIKYLAEWLNTFVTRQNRWRSAKYLIGESYGTVRVAGLALELQGSQWMYLNGVVLVSPTNLGVDRDGPVGVATRLPYFAAAAWYHNKLPAEHQSKDIDDFLPEVEEYTINKLIPAISKGSFLSDDQKQVTALQMSKYAGISEASILSHNLDVPTSFFWKELLREEGYTVGRLDSRYKGIDKMDAGTRPDFNSELTSWLHSFTPAINYYIREYLNFETDIKYNMFGPVHPWDRAGDETGEFLRKAMAQNPYLHTMIQSGIYDGATQYFDAKYTMWQMDPAGKLNDRLRFETYRSGHMMYLRREDLESSNEHLREFIIKATPSAGKPAKY